MKRSDILTLGAALLLSVVIPQMAMAADDMGLEPNEKLIGYSVTNDYSEEGAFVGEAGTYAMGALFEKNQLLPYAGCPIVGMRIASCGNQASTRVFIYDGADLGKPMMQQKQRLYPGWTNIRFNSEPYVIRGDESLFFGYDYVESEEIASENARAVLAVTGETTYGGFVLLRDGEFSQITESGVLCVQLIIDTTNLPSANLAFSFTDTGFKYKKLGEPLEFYASMSNVGRDNITGFTASVSFDGGTPVMVDADLKVAPGKSETWQTVIPTEGMEIGIHDMEVKIVKINGVDNEPNAASTCHKRFALYENSLRRAKSYMEVFSSQQYVYSSLLDEKLENLKAETDMPDSSKELFDPSTLEIAKIFEPETPLAAAGGETYWNLYAFDVPVFSVNRALFPGEANVAYSVNDYLGMPIPGLITGIMADIAMQDLEVPTFAEVNVETNYDKVSRQCDVTVSGKALPELKAICGTPVLSLLLVEDGVESPQAILAGSDAKLQDDYIHNDVIHAWLTGTGGIEIEPENDRYVVRHNFTLPEGCNSGNCRVVALISKKTEGMTADNIADFDVLNCNSAPLTDVTAVSGPATEDKIPSRRFRIDGTEVPAEDPSPGLYITIDRHGRASKQLRL